MHFLPVRSIACNNKSIFSRFHDKVIIGFRLWCRIDVQRMCFPQPRIAHIPGHPGNDIARSCFRTPEVINASAIPIRMQMGRQNQIHMACIKDRHKFLSFRRKSFFSPFPSCKGILQRILVHQNNFPLFIGPCQIISCPFLFSFKQIRIPFF